MKRPLRSLLPLLVLAAAACASNGLSEKEVLERMAARHDVELRAFHSARDELAAKYPMPQSLDFGNQGTVVLNGCSLGGRLGKEILRVRYTYVNTSGRPIREALLTLIVRDPATGAEEGEDMRLKFPYALTLTPDSSYTTWFEVPTRGLHLMPGWEWEVGLEAVHGPRGPWASRTAGS